ncbi:MAG: MmgE/PrpD family protein [Deltaproteobacteria bacterium]|nr:MmgE/PrpD family protein [Deltaproteobacteria bacterium]
MKQSGTPSPSPPADLQPAAEAPENSRLPLEGRLSRYAADIRYRDLPREVVAACKRLLLDTLACGFGAVGTAAATIAEETFRKSFGSGDAATLIGGKRPIAAEGAALVNGILIRELDLNDTYFGYDPSHPSEVLPAALACCEETRRSGRDLIEAMVVGYEVDLRLNDAFSWAARGFHSLSHGAFAIPLAAGKAWRLTPEQMAHAVGISGSHQLTSLAMNSGTISMMKALAPARTAMDSLFDTRLAAGGLTGPSSTLEWLIGHIQPIQTDVAVDLDPTRYRLTEVGLKRFPLQGNLQSSTEAAVNLAPQVKGRIDAIREIVVETTPTVLKRGLADREKYRPQSRGTADHSLPVCTAMALLDGDVTAAQFHGNRWQDPEVLALAGKVQVVVAEALVAKAPQGQGATVEIRFADGSVFKETVEVPEGDALRPLSRPALEGKFRQFADPVLGQRGAKRLMDLVDGLEQIEDVRLLTRAMQRQDP